MFTNSATKKDFDKAVRQLNDLANTIALTYFSNDFSRKAFYDEINRIISFVSQEIDNQCMSLQGGLITIQDELNSLKHQQFQLMTGRMIHYAAIEKKKTIKGYVNLMLKQVGFVGGGTQIVAGYGVCAASFGAACVAFGAPLIAQGANSFYENGYYLLFRKDKSGYVRKGYHQIARHLGYSSKDADTAYATVDLALSAYGLGRMTLKPDTFILYRHISSDFIRGWREMGRIPLGLEALSDGTTGFGIYQLKKDNQ